MKTLIISYSLTGNNATLAKGLGEHINANHYEVKELKKRNTFTIILDLLFNRTPKIVQPEADLLAYDHLVFVGPVWLGAVASPLRQLLCELKGSETPYSFVSISAGADGANTKLEADLMKRTGQKPAVVINPLITDLLPKTPKPSRKDLDAYRLNTADASRLITNTSKTLKTIIGTC